MRVMERWMAAGARLELVLREVTVLLRAELPRRRVAFTRP
jgi:hypothetical protein